jgi:hypothetical protein
LSNTVAGKATTDGGTIITIPAGSNWHGSVTISQLTNTAGTFYPDITVQGTGSDPAPGSAIISVIGFGALVGLVPMASSASIDDIDVFGDGIHPVTLQLNFHGCTSAVGTAVGYFQ